MECASNGYAVYVNGEFDHWFPGLDKAHNLFNFLRDMLADIDVVDLVDWTTGEVIASTVDWRHED